MFDMQSEDIPSAVQHVADMSGMDIDDSGTGLTGAPVNNMLATKQHTKRLTHWLQHKEEPYSTNGNSSPAVIKIALSLFKVQQNIYLLDFQRVEVSRCKHAACFTMLCYTMIYYTTG